MRRLGQLSPVLVPLLLQVLQHGAFDTVCDLDSVELFAGKAEIRNRMDAIKQYMSFRKVSWLLNNFYAYYPSYPPPLRIIER